MTEWVHRTIVVPEAYVALARSLAAASTKDAGGGGENMFTTPMNSTGSGTASHWVSSGLIRQEFAELLEDPQAVYDMAEGQVPLSTIKAMLDSSVIREDEDPHAVFAELGLKLVQPEV